MPLLIEYLAAQMLELTRVSTNAPLPAPNEPLRVDVVPGGAPGGQMTSALPVLGAANTEALRIDVTYEVQRDGTPLAPSEYVQLPTVTSETLPDGVPALGPLLSTAFLLRPRIRLVNRPAAPTVTVPMPALDHKVVVTLEVRSTTTVLDPLPSRTIEIPFTVPTIEIGLPIPGAVCILSENADLQVGSGESLVMIGPGSPGTVTELAETFNDLIDTVSALETVFQLASAAVTPLERVATALDGIPNPEVTTDEWVKDFDDYGTEDGFDDELRSLLIVGPTGYGVEFCDTANPGDWDDLSNHCHKTYTTIDVLQLPNSELGKHILEKLGMNLGNLTTLRDSVAALTGVTTDGVELGLGVFFVQDLEDASLDNEQDAELNTLRKYANCDVLIAEDCASARWTVS